MILKRVSVTVGAHVFGQLVTVFTILVLPWILLSTWTVSQYGEYLTALAVSQFFIFSDFGLSGAIGNKFVLDKYGSSAHFYQKKVLVVVVKIIMCVVVLFCGVGIFFDFPMAVFLLVISSAFQPILNVFQTKFRIDEKLHFGVLYNNFVRLLEFVAAALVSVIGYGVTEAAFCSLIVKILFVGHAAFSLWTVNLENNKFRIEENKSVFTGVLKPALGGLLNFWAVNILLQGLVLVVAVFGGGSVAIFSSARTLSRVAWQPIAVLYGGISPELTLLFSERQFNKLKKILVYKTIAVFGFSFCVALFIYFSAEWIELVWLRGKVKIPDGLLASMLISGVFHMTSQSMFQSLMAINKSFESSKIYLLISIFILTLAYFLITALGMFGISLLWLSGEFLFFLYALYVFKKTISAFF